VLLWGDADKFFTSDSATGCARRSARGLSRSPAGEQIPARRTHGWPTKSNPCCNADDAQRRKSTSEAPGAAARLALPGVNGACVIMAAAVASSKKPVHDRLRRRFQSRRLHSAWPFGLPIPRESGGTCQGNSCRIGDQLALAGTRPGSLRPSPGCPRTSSRYGILGLRRSSLHSCRPAPRVFRGDSPIHRCRGTRRDEQRRLRHTTPLTLARLNRARRFPK